MFLTEFKMFSIFLFQYVNPAYEKVTGYWRSEIVGNQKNNILSNCQVPSPVNNPTNYYQLCACLQCVDFDKNLIMVSRNTYFFRTLLCNVIAISKYFAGT